MPAHFQEAAGGCLPLSPMPPPDAHSVAGSGRSRGDATRAWPAATALTSPDPPPPAHPRRRDPPPRDRLPGRRTEERAAWSALSHARAVRPANVPITRMPQRPSAPTLFALIPTSGRDQQNWAGLPPRTQPLSLSRAETLQPTPIDLPVDSAAKPRLTEALAAPNRPPVSPTASCRLIMGGGHRSKPTPAPTPQFGPVRPFPASAARPPMPKAPPRRARPTGPLAGPPVPRRRLRAPPVSPEPVYGRFAAKTLCCCRSARPRPAVHSGRRVNAPDRLTGWRPRLAPRANAAGG